MCWSLISAEPTSRFSPPDRKNAADSSPAQTIRVSGYAVNFVRLTREQQMDVVNRTFHRVA